MNRTVPLFVAIAILGELSVAHALGKECMAIEGSTLAESCALQQELKEAEKELKAIYSKLMIQWKSNKFMSERTGLIASQRAWLAYRDEVCNFEQAVYGGSVSISFSRCIARITVDRVSYLKELH